MAPRKGEACYTIRPMSDRPRLLGLRIFAAAFAANLVFDALGARLPWTTPPWLLLDHLAGLFKELLSAEPDAGSFLDRSSIGIGMSIGASGVNAIIAALLATAFEDQPRRVRALGGSLAGLWLLSGGLMMITYLSPPWGVALGSLASGLPRSFALAWLLDRLLPARAGGPRSAAA